MLKSYIDNLHAGRALTFLQLISCKQFRLEWCLKAHQIGGHNPKLFNHKYVKKTGLSYFCTECQRLNVLLEYFDLFEETSFGTVSIRGGLSPLWYLALTCPTLFVSPVTNQKFIPLYKHPKNSYHYMYITNHCNDFKINNLINLKNIQLWQIGYCELPQPFTA